MPVATLVTSVGVRELKNNLSRYLGRVEAGEEFVVTDHGRPVARLQSIAAGEERLARLIAAGIVRPARTGRGPLPDPVTPSGTGNVSDLVAEQRR